MTFDPWAFEPPLGEFQSLTGWLCLASCLLGWVSCLWMLLRRRATPTDRSVWEAGLLLGSVAGSVLVVLGTMGVDPSPFTALLIEWMLSSAFGAGLLVWASSAQRRVLGRQVVQAVALFVLGLPIPALLTAGAIHLVKP